MARAPQLRWESPGAAAALVFSAALAVYAPSLARRPTAVDLAGTLLFALLALLVGQLLGRLLRDHADRQQLGAEERSLLARAALLGGLLFAVHSVHTEVVKQPSRLPELMATLAYGVALLSHLRWRRSWLVELVVLPSLYGAGLFSHPSAATLPAWLLLKTLFMEPEHRGALLEPGEARRRAIAGLARRYLPLALVLCSYVAVQGGLDLPSSRLGALGVAKLFAQYVQLWFLPRPPMSAAGDGLAYFGVAELTLLVLLILRMRDRAPLLALGLATFLITLLPAIHLSGLVGLEERLLLIPSMGAALASTIGFAVALRRHPRLGLAGGVVLVALLGLWTILRSGSFLS